jgi:hypothetical protein
VLFLTILFSRNSFKTCKILVFVFLTFWRISSHIFEKFKFWTSNSTIDIPNIKMHDGFIWKQPHILAILQPRLCESRCLALLQLQNMQPVSLLLWRLLVPLCHQNFPYQVPCLAKCLVSFLNYTRKYKEKNSKFHKYKGVRENVAGLPSHTSRTYSTYDSHNSTRYDRILKWFINFKDAIHCKHYERQRTHEGKCVILLYFNLPLTDLFGSIAETNENSKIQSSSHPTSAWIARYYAGIRLQEFWKC